MARLFPRLWNCLVNCGSTMDRTRRIAPRRRHVRPGVEALENRLTPASIQWDGGGGDGLWGTAANWENDTIPGAADIAVIGPGYNVVGNLPNIAVDAISCSSPITFNGNFSIGGVQIMSYIDKNVVFNGELTLGGTLNLGDLMGGGGLFNADVHIALGKELMLSSGTFTFYEGVEVDGDGLVRVYSATAAVGTNAVIMRNLYLMNSMSKVTGSGGSLTIKNDMTFPAGRVEGSGTLIIQSGALNMPEPADKTIIGWGVNNFAATNWTGGNIVTSGSVFTNKLGGVFNLNDFAGNWTATGGSFENQGTFRSNEAEHVMAIEFVSTNQAQVLSGNVTFTQGREFGGTVTIQANSSVTLGAGSYTFNSGLTIQGQGVMIQAGANTTVVGTVNADNYELRSGTLDGAGDFVVRQSFDWSGGSMTGVGGTTVQSTASAEISGPANKSLVARILHNETTMTYIGGTLTFSNGAMLDNLGTFDIQGDLSIADGGGAPPSSIFNEGEFKKSQGSGGQSSVDVYFNNLDGTIKVQAGALIFNAILDFTGNTPTLDLSLGAECKVYLMNLNAGTITGAGTLSTLPAGTINWYTGNATGTGTIHVVGGGSLLKIDGPMMMDGFTLNNEWSVDWRSGTIAVNGGGLINNQPGANFRAFSDNDMTGSGVFHNYGTFTKMQGVPPGPADVATKIFIGFHNKSLAEQPAARVVANIGTVSFRNAGMHNAPFEAAAAGAVEFTGLTSSQIIQQGTIFVGPGTFFLSGTARIDIQAGVLLRANANAVFVLGPRFAMLFGAAAGGTLTGAGTFVNDVATTRWVVGTVLGLHDFVNNSQLNIVPDSGLKDLNNSNLLNNGTITWTGGTITMSNAATITNLNIFDVQTDSTISDFGAGPATGIQNAKTFKKTAGSGTTTIQVPYQQAGGEASFELNGRNMTFTKDFFQSGGQATMGDGLTGGGSLTIEGKYNLESAATLSIDEGVLTANDGLIVNGTVSNAIGTINGDVTNAGWMDLGPFILGNLLINGDYTQTSSGVLLFEISSGGVFYDTMTVNGLFTAGGALIVVGWSGFDPPVGAQFELIEFWWHAGEFSSQQLPTLGGGKTWKQQRWFDFVFMLEVE